MIKPTAKLRGCIRCEFPRRRSTLVGVGSPLRILRKCLVLLSFFVGVLGVVGQDKPTEYEVKAAYLLNFGKFIRSAQPSLSGSGNSFDICIIGDSPIEAPLRAVTANESIGDRPIRILHSKDGSQARTCQIAYLSASEGPRLAQDLEELRGADALTVSDTSSFLAEGGMIEFLLVSNHVRFSVDLGAVKRTHLVLSSEFLRVAYSVSGQPGKVGAP